MPARKLPKDYHELAESKGIKWLGPEVPNTHTKTKWQCAQGHEWRAPYNRINQKHGCPFCVGKAPKVPADYHALARKKNFQWIGPMVPKVTIKTRWLCERGHVFASDHHSIKKGSGCSFCAGNAPITHEGYKSLARNRNFKWCGPMVPNTSTPTTWECEKKHRWMASYSNIKNGSNCPKCSSIAPLTASDYYALGQKRGFNWCEPAAAPNIQTKTTWECIGGHRWSATYSNIYRGTGCPHCVDIVNGHRVSKLQRQLCEMLDGELNYPCGSYRIDVALSKEKIAIEYDSWYWHGDRLEGDAERDKELLSAGWKILHIKSNSKLPTQYQLGAALALLRNGEVLTEIVLRDWGKGSIFGARDHAEGSFLFNQLGFL